VSSIDFGSLVIFRKLMELSNGKPRQNSIPLRVPRSRQILTIRTGLNDRERVEVQGEAA